jgi:hypothetical protein
MLHAFEREILRIRGPVHEKGHWCLGWNTEIYSLYQDLNIVDDIRIRRLGSAGHIIRMEEEMIPKIFLMEKSTSLV